MERSLNWAAVKYQKASIPLTRDQSECSQWLYPFMWPITVGKNRGKHAQKQKFVLLISYFVTMVHEFRLALNSLCTQGCPWTHCVHEGDPELLLFLPSPPNQFREAFASCLLTSRYEDIDKWTEFPNKRTFQCSQKVQHAKRDAEPVLKIFHGVTSEEFHWKSPIKHMIASVSVVFCLDIFTKWQDEEDDFLKDMYWRMT